LFQRGTDVFGGGSMFRVDLTTFDEHMVSNGVDVDRDAEWARDGSRIALVRNAQSLWTVLADGSDAHEVTSDSSLFFQGPQWSPDGSRIIYVAADAGTNPSRIYSAASTGSGSPAFLTLGSEGRGPLAWSTDGSKILFVSNRTGNLDAFLMNANGGSPTNISNRAQDDSAPEWSPDGDDVALVFQGRIWLFAPDGTNPRNLTGTSTNGDGQPHWSPDSSQLFFVRGTALYVMNRNGANQHAIGISSVLDFAVSPTGAKIAWIGTQEDMSGELYVANADGSLPTRVTNNADKEFHPRWRPCPH
jgi:TolB protein